MQTTCQCDHMTNFAVLRSKLLPPEQGEVSGAQNWLSASDKERTMKYIQLFNKREYIFI